MTGPVGWLLTIEPFGASLGWSLIRDDGRELQVEAGTVEDPRGTIRDMARRAVPMNGAGPDVHGLAGPWAGALTDPDQEFDIAVSLGEALLPPTLRTALLSRVSDPTTSVDTVTIATRGWPARIAWELLALDRAGRRLLERAIVAGGLSAAVTATRTRRAPATDVARFGYAVLDPGPLEGANRSLYPAGYPEPLVRQLGALGDDYTPADRGLTADELAYQLHRAPSRLLYVGHIRPGPEGAPAGAAFVLRGTRVNTPGLLTARDWLASPGRWPSPARVALIGCASDDTGPFEQSGLVIAAVNAGAHLVTATRWPLPTDHLPGSACTPTQPVHHHGLTDLALAVHDAHSQPHPVSTLRKWQLAQLARWRDSGQLQHSPVLWAATITYDAAATPREQKQ